MELSRAEIFAQISESLEGPSWVASSLGLCENNTSSTVQEDRIMHKCGHDVRTVNSECSNTDLCDTAMCVVT